MAQYCCISFNLSVTRHRPSKIDKVSHLSHVTINTDKIPNQVQNSEISFFKHIFRAVMHHGYRSDQPKYTYSLSMSRSEGLLSLCHQNLVLSLFLVFLCFPQPISSAATGSFTSTISLSSPVSVKYHIRACRISRTTVQFNVAHPTCVFFGNANEIC
jgi:hypothetical protein